MLTPCKHFHNLHNTKLFFTKTTSLAISFSKIQSKTLTSSLFYYNGCSIYQLDGFYAIWLKKNRSKEFLNRFYILLTIFLNAAVSQKKERSGRFIQFLSNLSIMFHFINRFFHRYTGRVTLRPHPFIIVLVTILP